MFRFLKYFMAVITLIGLPFATYHVNDYVFFSSDLSKVADFVEADSVRTVGVTSFVYNSHPGVPGNNTPTPHTLSLANTNKQWTAVLITSSHNIFKGPRGAKPTSAHGNLWQASCSFINNLKNGLFPHNTKLVHLELSAPHYRGCGEYYSTGTDELPEKYPGQHSPAYLFIVNGAQANAVYDHIEQAAWVDAFILNSTASGAAYASLTSVYSTKDFPVVALIRPDGVVAGYISGDYSSRQITNTLKSVVNERAPGDFYVSDIYNRLVNITNVTGLSLQPETQYPVFDWHKHLNNRRKMGRTVVTKNEFFRLVTAHKMTSKEDLLAFYTERRSVFQMDKMLESFNNDH